PLGLRDGAFVMAQIDGSILTPEGWVAGRVRFGERIEAVEGAPVETPHPPFVLPGFVDLHVHGGGGADLVAGQGAIRPAADARLRHGTTSMLATSVTAPVDRIGAFLDAVRTAAAGWDGAAQILGAHLEGPFINPDRLGAQPPFAIPADAATMRGWLARGPVRVVTFAPEMDPDRATMNLLMA